MKSFNFLENRRYYLLDPEFWFIVIYNLSIVFLYLTDRIDPYAVIWAYYLQSLLIGAQFVVSSIATRVRESGSFFPLKKHAFTFFFIAHFGLFHLVYFVFIISMSSKSEDVVSLYKFVGYSFGYLLFNLLFFSIREIIPSTPIHVKPNIIAPYMRLLPIHVFIMIGFARDTMIVKGFIIFIILKIFFDLLVYLLTGGERDKD